MLIRGESREVWIFSLTASCCTTLWKTICYPCLLASLAFTFPKLRASKQRKHFQVQVKSSEENVKVDDFFFLVFKVGCHTIGKIWNISLVHSCSIIIWNIFVLFTWHYICTTLQIEQWLKTKLVHSHPTHHLDVDVC